MFFMYSFMRCHKLEICTCTAILYVFYLNKYIVNNHVLPIPRFLSNVSVQLVRSKNVKL